MLRRPFVAPIVISRARGGGPDARQTTPGSRVAGFPLQHPPVLLDRPLPESDPGIEVSELSTQIGIRRVESLCRLEARNRLVKVSRVAKGPSHDVVQAPSVTRHPGRRLVLPKGSGPIAGSLEHASQLEMGPAVVRSLSEHLAPESHRTVPLPSLH